MKNIKQICIPIYMLLLCLGILLLGAWDMQHAEAARLTWAPATPVPEPIASQMVKCVEDPDRFYLVGGALSVGGGMPIVANTLYRYTISTGVWDQLPDMPGERQGLITTCYQGKIYAAGGLYIVGSDIIVTKTLYIYDILTGLWSRSTDLPDVIDFGAMGAWDGKLYVIGGAREHQYLTPVDRVDVYDIASSTWTAGGGADLPFAATHFGFGAQAGPYIYIVGGIGTPYPFHHLNQTQRYNMATNEWELGPEFNSARANHSVAVTGNHLYAISGDLEGGGEYEPVTLVEALDLSTWPSGTWEDLQDPLPQGLIQSVSTCSNVLTGGEIWVVGGVTSELIPVDTNLYHPTEPCVSFGVDLSEPMEGEGAAGQTVTYTLSITNTGLVVDYYTLEITALWGFSAPAGDIGPIEAGESIQIEIVVSIPPEAVWGNQDVAEISVVSIGNPAEQDITSITTTSTTVWTRMFMPLAMKH